MKKKWNILILITLNLISFFTMAEQPAQQLVRLLQDVQTFNADFEQTLISSKGNVIQQTDGHLKAKKPGYFRWYTAPPLEQILVTNGKNVWLYDPDLEQVTIQALSDQFSRTPALLLSGEVEDIAKHYLISVIPNEKNQQLFKLSPKSPDSLFDSLYLVFKQNQLKSMVLKDSLGQETSLMFSNQQINKGFSEKEFHFEIPEGVDVIRQ